jgi:predicted RNase H-like HicB family nuclease
MFFCCGSWHHVGSLGHRRREDLVCELAGRVATQDCDDLLVCPHHESTAVALSLDEDRDGAGSVTPKLDHRCLCHSKRASTVPDALDGAVPEESPEGALGDARAARGGVDGQRVAIERRADGQAVFLDGVALGPRHENRAVLAAGLNGRRPRACSCLVRRQALWLFKNAMRYLIEVEREADGRYLAEVPELPGVMCYGATLEQALAKVEALALRVLADRLEHGELAPAGLDPISFAQAPAA